MIDVVDIQSFVATLVSFQIAQISYSPVTSLIWWEMMNNIA